jgi:hypothetical protein
LSVIRLFPGFARRLEKLPERQLDAESANKARLNVRYQLTAKVTYVVSPDR